MAEANSINAATTGIVGNTGTGFTGTAVTQYNVLTGAATSSTLNNVAPSATSGVPLISQGSSAQPAFGTSVVAGGGTGIVTTTAYAPICGGTTATGAFQAASTNQSNSGYVLTSTGASSLPTWQAPTSGVTGPVSSTDRAISTWNGTGGTALFNNTTPIIDSTGRFTNTVQPAFLYYLGTTVNDVSGTGTFYTIGSTQALTQVFDRNSNMNTNGTFTAPVTGLYCFQVSVLFTGVIAGTECRISFVGPSYTLNVSHNTPSLTGTFGSGSTASLLLSASDTVTFQCYIFGMATDDADLVGNASPYNTWVSGYLVC